MVCGQPARTTRRRNAHGMDVDARKDLEPVQPSANVRNEFPNQALPRRVLTQLLKGAVT